MSENITEQRKAARAAAIHLAKENRQGYAIVWIDGDDLFHPFSHGELKYLHPGNFFPGRAVEWSKRPTLPNQKGFWQKYQANDVIDSRDLDDPQMDLYRRLVEASSFRFTEVDQGFDE